MYDPNYEPMIYYVLRSKLTGEVFISHLRPYSETETLLDEYTTVNGAKADFPDAKVYAPLENDADRK